MNNEVNALNRRIYNAEFFDSQGESTFEELLIEVLDDGLLALQVVNVPDVDTDGVIERLQFGGVLIEASYICQQLDHAVHGAADCVVVYKVVIFEQRVENWLRDKVLSQHFNGLSFIDGGIEVILQSLDEDSELGRKFRNILNEFRNTLDELTGYHADGLRPVFPIEAVAALLDEFSVNAILHFAKTDFELLSNLGIFNLLCVVSILAVGHGIMAYAGASDDNFGRFVFIEGNFVDLSIKAIVVRTECVKDAPDGCEISIVIECLFGCNIGRHNDRDNDISVFLFVGLTLAEVAHDTSDRLHDINL